MAQRIASGLQQIQVKLLFPVEAGSALPEVTRHPDNTVTVVVEGKEYNFSLNELNR